MPNLIWPFGFAAQKPMEYAGSLPELSLQQHLAGPMLCDGMIFGPTGKMVSRFNADMQGDWTDQTGVLKERFTFATGTVQDREWSITLGEKGHFQGQARDIIGTMQGQLSGATARMQYKLKLDADAGGHVLNVVDWMYLTESGTILNRAQMRKFGVKVAELVASFYPKR